MNLRGFMFFTFRSCRGFFWDPPKPSKVMGNFSPAPHATPPSICRNLALCPCWDPQSPRGDRAHPARGFSSHRNNLS